MLLVYGKKQHDLIVSSSVVDFWNQRFRERVSRYFAEREGQAMYRRISFVGGFSPSIFLLRVHRSIYPGNGFLALRVLRFPES